MCTALSIKGKSFCFGRNMDIEHGFGERVVLTPRGYSFSFLLTEAPTTHYAMLGMAAVVNGYPLYADAMNERGLCMAGLHFPGNAHYAEKAKKEGISLSYTEMIPYLLGTCATVREARAVLEQVTVMASSNPEGLEPSPLHWMLADGHEALVVEPMREGLMLYENPYGVLTNNPPFPCQAAALCRYCHLSPKQPSDGWLSPAESKSSYSFGLGSMGMPGDYSSPSRFVKAAYLRQAYLSYGGEVEPSPFFRILGAVGPVEGSVLTEKGESHHTAYSCCMDADQGIYYYQTVQNSRPTAVRLFGVNLDTVNLREYTLRCQPDILWEE